LTNKKYPEFFRLVERDIGDRNDFVNLIKLLLVPPTRNLAVIYELIGKWPFACYLTTNFDDEIVDSLSRMKEHFTVIRNRKEDFFSIRDGASNLIQKLHSDLEHPDEVVLTAVDYQRLYATDAGQYFCDKLRQIFEMWQCIIDCVN